MITPQELESKDFSLSVRGYNRDEIDTFLDLLQKDYEYLYIDNASLKSKLNILAEKIEEYKKIEESLRNALISAQNISESMIEGAKQKAELIITEAQLKSDKVISGINTQIYKEKQKLEETKRENEIFAAKIISMYSSQTKLIENIQRECIIDKKEEITSDSIMESIEKKIEEDRIKINELPIEILD